jgi:hypothetical protein
MRFIFNSSDLHDLVPEREGVAKTSTKGTHPLLGGTLGPSRLSTAWNPTGIWPARAYTAAEERLRAPTITWRCAYLEIHQVSKVQQTDAAAAVM